MTINFALSLSLAGIDLLQRIDSGWRRVGTASLLSTDIAAELADLRAKGQALAPDGFHTKLVIPMEQVKYLTIETAQTTLADVSSALDGTTPYALDELAIDFERSGGRTHIAAVARETLREAEDFADAHGFNPVAFVAVPDPVTFAQEIFFGPTSMATRILGPDVELTRDTMPVTLVGTRIKSHLLLVDQPEAVETETPVASEPALLDRIIAEYHLPDEPQQVPPAAVRIVLSDVAPTAPAHLDRVIAEYHQPATQTEVPMLAVPAPGSPKPLVLGGVMARQSKAVAPVPARSFAVPGAIAASLAALGFLWWSQSGPEPVAPADVSAEVSSETAPEPAVVDIAIATPEPRPFAADLPGSDTDVAASPPVQPSASDTADSAAIATQPASPAETPVQTTLPGRVLSADEAEAAYAATGVWQRPPRFVDLPPAVETDDVIWPVSAVAPDRMSIPVLPSITALSTDLGFVALPNPPAADVVFDLDEDGFVRATPEGAMTPDGAVVYAGLPDLPFRERPGSVAENPPVAEDEEAQTDTSTGPNPVSDDDDSSQIAVNEALASVLVIPGPPPVVPPLRPATIEESASIDDTTPGGVSLSGLQPGAEAVVDLAPPPGAIRPQARPALPAAADSANEVEAVLGGIALAEPDLRDTSSAFAVATSLRPTSRPVNFDRVVAAVRDRQQAAPAAVAAAPAAPAPAPQPQVQAAAPVAPQNYEPVPGGVARAATREGVIRMRDMNLIGVYGQPSARRALVRLGNGQFIRVQVGSELDGGQVTAIGENALNYVKRGTTYALQIPQG
jgi:hypothetical protein